MLRAADAEDAHRTLAFFLAVAAETDQIATQPDEYGDDPQREVERIREHADDPCKLWLVAEHDAQIVATLRFRAESRRRLAHAGTFGVVVGSAWRGDGIGRAMIERLLEWASEHPAIEKVCLAVFSSNPLAIGLYERLGFVAEGRRMAQCKLGRGRYVDEIMMGRWVKPPPFGADVR